MKERRRRLSVILVAALLVVAGVAYDSLQSRTDSPSEVRSAIAEKPNGTATDSSAAAALGKLAIKGRAPRNDYKRTQFSDGWAQVGLCDVRNHILQRDLTDVKTVSETDCTVLSGNLDDPYTGNQIQFIRGSTTSADVQIDHVVALSDAWQKGAQQMAITDRHAFANDPLNLLAVDGPTNVKKGNGDAATWLPSNKPYRCRYVARQIAVKVKYTLWITHAEHDAMVRILQTCPGQLLPEVVQ